MAYRIEAFGGTCANEISECQNRSLRPGGSKLFRERYLLRPRNRLSREHQYQLLKNRPMNLLELLIVQCSYRDSRHLCAEHGVKWPNFNHN